MPDRFFLNELKSKDRNLGAPEPGSWMTDENGQGFLIKYALDIPLEGQMADSRTAHPVPSVFSRPIQFYQALEAREHPLHDTIRSEWRGLLALFGLQHWLDVVLTQREYRIPAISAVGAGDRHIAAALRSQLPRPASDWDHWWLISCDGRLVGATSPWTVAYTPAEYTAPETVPWRTPAGLLGDPIDYYGPRAGDRSPELALLHRWVELVLEQQRDPSNRNWGFPDHLEPRAAVVTRQLSAWKKDLEVYRDETLAAPELEPHSIFTKAPFSCFLRTPMAERVELPGSDYLLAGSRGEPTLVFSETGVDPHRRVHGAVFGDQVDLESLASRPRGTADWKARNGHAIPLPYVIAERVFFSSKLAEVPLADRSLVRGSKRYALPLSAEFFRSFEAADLAAGKVKLEIQERDDRVLARMWLPLVGGTVLRVEKTYERGRDLVERHGIPVPALAIWPDFFSPDWREHFAVCSAGKAEPAGPHGRTPQTPFLAAPLLSDGSVLRKIRDDGTQQSLRIWHTSAPPIGFALFENTDDPGSAPSEAGVVLRASYDEPRPSCSETTWDAAVDFGTCNTHVMITGPDGDPVPLQFQPRTIHLVEAEIARRNDVWAFFYPSEGMRTPLPWSTLLTRRASTFLSRKGQPDIEDDGPLVPAFVFLLEEDKHIGIYVRDVKWGESASGDGETNLQHYLRGLVRYIACEAWSQGINRLNLSWSYPLSLPLPARRAMTSFWKTVGPDIISGHRLTIQVKESLSESEAICRHMAMRGIGDVRSDALAIAVDVGGGSTEAGFWSSGSLIDCVSIRIAGNDLLFPFRGNSEFISSLWSLCRPREIPDKFREDFAERPELMFNSLLVQAGSAPHAAGRDQGPHNHPVPVGLFGGQVQHGASPWREVRSLIYLFFAGLTYYLGLHTRKAIQELPKVEIHLGGLGSSLLTWVSADGERLAEILSWVFRQGFTRDGLDRREISVVVQGSVIRSDTALPLKEEVVRGLLCPPLPYRSDRPGVDGMSRAIVGEIGWTNERMRPLNWDDLLSPAEVWTIRPPANLESGYLAHFLSDVVSEHAEEFRLDAQGYKQAWIEPAAVQESLRRSAGTGWMVMEPIFAAELRAVMQQYARLASRGERLLTTGMFTP